MDKKTEIVIMTEQSLKSKVHLIRGQSVMLDFELAEIYGYETKNFNRQVKNNMERFEGEDFRFQLTRDEFENLRCKNFTSSWGGMRHLPYAFTEQGIYLLMTVLKGDLAVSQSRKLVRLFKEMKDYLLMNQVQYIPPRWIDLAERVKKNEEEIKGIKDNMVQKADLSDFLKLFDSNCETDEVLILDGQPFKADMAYQKIYRKAKNSILLIDDYIGLKTLHHLAVAKKHINIKIVSDNRGRPPLRNSEYVDYTAEYPGRNVVFLRSGRKIHDRFIVLDNGTADMKIYLCGGSSKDGGKKITTITQLNNVSAYHGLVANLLSNPPLVLR